MEIGIIQLGANFLDFVLHIDRHLNLLISHYGTLTYVILFVIIFMETGFVITPFLPGDSLLFAAGTICALGALDILSLFTLLVTAAISGDNVNYCIGYHIGPKIFSKENVRFLNRKHLDRTHQFYEKYGGKTIIMARFMPIIRTFAPFVAGIGRMTYLRFLSYDIAGGILWIGICSFSGYFFGNIPVIKNNFSVVILVIIFISILPAIIETLKFKLCSNK